MSAAPAIRLSIDNWPRELPINDLKEALKSAGAQIVGPYVKAKNHLLVYFATQSVANTVHEVFNDIRVGNSNRVCATWLYVKTVDPAPPSPDDFPRVCDKDGLMHAIRNRFIGITFWYVTSHFILTFISNLT